MRRYRPTVYVHDDHHHGRCDGCGATTAVTTMWADDPDLVAEVCDGCMPNYEADGFHLPD